MRRLIALSMTVSIAAAMAAGSLSAQIPDEFTNLKVLPEDIGKRELMSTMKGMSGALGVRCSFCHVPGDEGQGLAGFDFASDEPEHKDMARAMMLMVQDINANQIPKAGIEDPTGVSCMTCHRGVKSPQSLKNLMLSSHETDGAAGAEKLYRELRDEYYGRGTYDFGPGTVNSVSEALAQSAEDVEGAAALMRMNVEFHPDAAYSHLLLGQILAEAGDLPGAVASVERALEIDPDNRHAKRILEQLQETGK